MRWFDIVRLRLRSLLRRSAVEQELEEELQYHLERERDANAAQGMTHAEARLVALRAINGLEQRKEECRDVRGVTVIECFIADMRFALRQLRKSPGFTLTALLMLGLGVSASVAIFAFVDAALLKPLPYPDSARLMRVFETYQHGARNGLSYLDYLDFKKQNRAFRSTGAFSYETFRLSSTAGAEAATGFRVSDGFLRTLGVTPALGRDFYDGEDLPGKTRTVLLSYGAWQYRYGGNPNIIGQTVTLDGNANTIIGVLPKTFYFGASNAEFWAALHAGGGCEDRRNCHNLQVVGRLKDGLPRESAEANLAVVARQLEAQYPATNRGWTTALMPLSETFVENVRSVLLMLLSGAVLLLIIGSVNVAGLLLVRSEGRMREMAVRSALGASRGRIMGQFFAEGLVLVVIGSTLGLTLASWTMQVLLRMIPVGMMEFMPFLASLGLNIRMLGFVAVIALLAAVQFAIVPAFRLHGAGLSEGSRGSSGNVWRRLGSKMVMAELATAAVLLVGAGLLSKSLYRFLEVDLGFRPEHVVTLQIEAPRSGAGVEKSIALEQDILNRLEALPGVTSAGIASDLPVLNDWGGGTNIRLLGRPWNGENNPTVEREVSSAYFTTLGARLRHGRYFSRAEDVSKPAVVVVNVAFARKYYPGEDPVGKQISYDVGRPLSPIEIIGVVEDIKEGHADSPDQAAMYVPFVHYPGTYFNLIVRTSLAEQPMVAAMTAAIRQINPQIATKGGGSLAGLINESGSAYLHRSVAWLVGAFATLALLMAVVGLYGVVAYSVSQRTREIGIRMALGATRGTVSALVMREAGGLTLLGIAIGLLGAVGAVSLMRGFLFGVSPWDAPTLIAVSIVLGGSALVASFVPARRAASVSPVEALRAE